MSPYRHYFIEAFFFSSSINELDISKKKANAYNLYTEAESGHGTDIFNDHHIQMCSSLCTQFAYALSATVPAITIILDANHHADIHSFKRS